MSGEQLISPRTHASKIEQNYKIKKCHINAVNLSEVVNNRTSNIPTIDYGHHITDKYCKNSIIIDFKFSNNEINSCRTCQICFGLFFPQIFSPTKKNIEQRNDNLFSQRDRILIDTAPTQINTKIIMKTALNFHKFRNLSRYSLQILTNARFKTVDLFKYSKLLQSGDIEPNPGPGKVVISINTYNIRGLKCKLKLKRVLNSCHKLVNQNNSSVIFLQETHLEIDDIKSMQMMWRHSFILSPGTNRQCGCLILFSSEWKSMYQETDNDGRFCITVLERFERSFLLVNIYAPNDHNINFFCQSF